MVEGIDFCLSSGPVRECTRDIFVALANEKNDTGMPISESSSTGISGRFNLAETGGAPWPPRRPLSTSRATRLAEI